MWSTEDEHKGASSAGSLGRANREILTAEKESSWWKYLPADRVAQGEAGRLGPGACTQLCGRPFDAKILSRLAPDRRYTRTHEPVD